MTRKLTLPKLRIARIRPAVVVWILPASSASTSSAIVFVRVNARGYAATPRRWRSSKFARRWRSWSDSFCCSVCCSSVIVCCCLRPTAHHEAHEGHKDHEEFEQEKQEFRSNYVLKISTFS